MEDKYFYLVFSKTGTLLSKSIGYVTSTTYTHVSISFDSSFNNMYTFGRINPNNPLSGGFVIESLSEGVYKKFVNSKCLVYKVKVTEDQLNLLHLELDKFLNSDIDFKYNFLGLFGVYFGRPLERQAHYFCSQFVSTLLINSNIYLTDKGPGLISPTDLTNINDFEIIYEGLVNNYSYLDEDFSVAL